MELNHVVFAIIILILASIWWFLYHRNEADLAAARAAVQAVIAKQRADLTSYNVRSELQLTKLEQVRQAHSESTQSYSQFASENGVSGGAKKVELDRETEIVCGNAYAKVFDSQRQLEAATNMVRAFLESIEFFRKKWREQIEQLVAEYPITLTNPEETYLDQLLALPNEIVDTQSKLKAALRVA